MEIVAFDSDSVGATSQIEPNWRLAMKSAIRDPAELCRELQLPEKYVEPARQVSRQFPLFAPRSYVERMQPGNPHDPLLLQVLPLAEETIETEGYSVDPVDDSSARLEPGLLQKYASRVLLITTGACAIHCRYCFRRHFPYAEAPHSLEQWEPAFEAIRADTSLREVILSGGDPLTLSDEYVETIIQRAAAIPHIRRLRIHTRLPIVIPERITAKLIGVLKRTHLSAIMVVHANHVAELDQRVELVLRRLVESGIVLLNQTVLLRKINDSVQALMQLSERLVDLRVIPYYLHQLDRVQGAAHFFVPAERGRELIQQLRQNLPGYAVPRYVAELPGEPYKVSLDAMD